MPIDQGTAISWTSSVHVEAYLYGGEITVGPKTQRPAYGPGAAEGVLYLAYKSGTLDAMAHHPTMRTLAEALALPEAGQADPTQLTAAVRRFFHEREKRATAKKGTPEAPFAKVGKAPGGADIDFSLAPEYRIIAYDLETTGLSTTHDKIVEVCFMDTATNEMFSSLVNPSCRIPKEVQKIHHITDEMVRTMPNFAQLAPKLAAFLRLQGANAKPNERIILMAHGGGGMDEPMLRAHFNAVGLPLDEDKVLFVDTYRMFAERREDEAIKKQAQSLASLRLGDIQKSFKVKVEMKGKLTAAEKKKQKKIESNIAAQLHRAGMDVQVMWETVACLFNCQDLPTEKRVPIILKAIGRNLGESPAKNCLTSRGTALSEIATVKLPGYVATMEQLTPRQRDSLMKRRLTDDNTFKLLGAAGCHAAQILYRRRKIESRITQFMDSDKNGRFAFIHPDSCVRQHIFACNTATGRTTSTCPPCQTIPKEDSSKMRQAFSSRFGRDKGLIVEIDYKQLEIAVLAAISQDARMVDDLRNGVDFHLRRVQMLFAHGGESYETLAKRLKEGDKVVKQWRRKAKIISFQRMYGAGAKTLASYSGIPIADIEEMIVKEEETFAGIKEHNDRVKQMLFRSGNPGLPLAYVYELPTGARVSFAHKDALLGLPPLKNYPIQSYATEILQPSLSLLARRFLETNHYGGRAFCTNYVHDSVWFDCHQDVAEELVKDATDILGSAHRLVRQNFPSVPDTVEFAVTTTIGRDLYDMVDFARWKADRSLV